MMLIRGFIFGPYTLLSGEDAEDQIMIHIFPAGTSSERSKAGLSTERHVSVDSYLIIALSSKDGYRPEKFAYSSSDRWTGARFFDRRIIYGLGFNSIEPTGWHINYRIAPLSMVAEYRTESLQVLDPISRSLSGLDEAL